MTKCSYWKALIWLTILLLTGMAMVAVFTLDSLRNGVNLMFQSYATNENYEFLIKYRDYGYDIKAVDENNLTLLHWAAGEGWDMIVVRGVAVILGNCSLRKNSFLR